MMINVRRRDPDNNGHISRVININRIAGVHNIVERNVCARPAYLSSTLRGGMRR